VDWSYGLLSATEKPLFRALSVFPCGWTLEAAIAVASPGADEFEVLDGLAHLVDKSLVVKGEGMGAARYGFLETIRQYGREALDATSGAGLARDRHAAFSLALAEEAEPRIKGAEQNVWLDRLDIEHGNLRAAIH
jgi:predicted ATPase